MQKKPLRKIWITWERHRRSIILAEQFGAELFIFDDTFNNDFFRYIFLLYKTINLILRNRPDVVFCQNPSLVLTSALSIMKYIFDFILIVDRHSNFKFLTQNSRNIKWIIFHLLSDFTLKIADITIVTNFPLASIVEKKGGKVFVLPDKIPLFRKPNLMPVLEGSVNFLFICTFSKDEPVGLVLDVFSVMPDAYHLYVTGNYNKFDNLRQYSMFNNIHFLGFLPDEEYISYLFGCNVIIVLTTEDMTLNCGSYESVAAEKVQIVYGSDVIKDYFNSGAVYLSNFNENDLIISIFSAVEKFKNSDGDEVAMLRKELDSDWDIKFGKISKMIESII